MAKKILSPKFTQGAFISKGDIVEYEVPYGTQIITVTAVEINLVNGEAIIHGVCEKGNAWMVPGRNVRRVENKELMLA